MQPDTIIPSPSNPQSWNRFSYVYNHPIILSDPTGHEPITIFVLIISAALILSSCAPSPEEQLQSAIDQANESGSEEDYQKAIDLAIELYSIDTHGVKQNYSAGLSGATGETYLAGDYEIGEDGKVTGGYTGVIIGKDAFKSTDDLLSTILHESYHVEQYQSGRWYTGDTAKFLREVEAYDYVDSINDKYGISDEVIGKEKEVRDSYYFILPDYLKKRVDKGDYSYVPE